MITPSRAARGKWAPGGSVGPGGAVAALILGPGTWDLDIITDGTSGNDADAVDLTCDGRISDLPLLVGSTVAHHHYVFVTSVQCSIAAALNRGNSGSVYLIITATLRP